MDDYMPDEMYRLFNDKATTSSMNKIINKWTNFIKGKNTNERKYENRFRERKIVDFTLSNNEFTALGHTNLFTSSYGKIKKINGVYNVNITVLIQYRDTFDDVKNILALGSQNNSRKELEGGNPFGMETQKKEIKINKTLKSLKEIENEIKRKLSQRREE